MRKSEKTAAKINELEAALLAAHASIPHAEKALADAYADSGDISKAQSSLQACRDAVPALIGALSSLDQRYHAEAFSEYSEASEALSKSMEATFKKTLADLEAGLRPVGKTLIAAGVPETSLYELREKLESALWFALDESAGAKAQDLPRPPQPIRKRDPQTGKAL
ncbi:MAG: hypothetical protein AB7T74_03045 [Clostridia bacterium]